MTDRHDLQQIFSDELRAVAWSTDRRTVATWYGGTTFQVFSVSADGSITEVDVFTLSDDEGRAVDRSRAVQHMNDWLDQNA